MGCSLTVLLLANPGSLHTDTLIKKMRKAVYAEIREYYSLTVYEG